MAKKKAAKKTTNSAPKRVPGSITDQIDRLEVGQCVSACERVPVNKATAEGILECLKRMRNNIAAYVSRVKDPDLDLREFKTESGSFITEDKTGIMLVATVTRTD